MTAQLFCQARHHHGKTPAQQRTICIGQIMGAVYAQRLQFRREPAPYPPDILNRSELEQSLPPYCIFQHDHPAGTGIFLTGISREFGQGLAGTNPNRHGKTRPLADGAAQFRSKIRQLADTTQIGKGLVYGILLHRRAVHGKDAHHPLRHIRVQGVV